MKKSELIILFCLLQVTIGLVNIPAQPAYSKKVDYKPKGVNLEHKLNIKAIIQDEDVLSLLASNDFNTTAPVDILNNEVYLDKNPNSNVYYYIPGSFRLGYNTKKGSYKIKLALPEDTEENTTDKVRFTAVFVPNIDKEGEKILEKIIIRYTNKKNAKVLPVIFNAKPEVEFSTFSSFNIDENSIVVSENSDYTKPVTISWAVDKSKADNLLIAMADDIAFDGKLYLNTDAERVKEVPIHLNLLSPKTLGTFLYKKPSNLFLKGFENKTSFPIRLNKIIVLAHKNSNKIIHKKHSLYAAKVAPRAIYKDFPAEIVRQVRLTPQNKILLEYEIEECEECKTEAANSILRNRIAKVEDQVTITDFKAYSFTKATEIRLVIENIYKEILVNQTAIDEAGNVTKLAKTTFAAPRKVSGELYYNYRILIYTANRVRPYRSRLIKSNKPSIDLTEDFIKKHFREFKYKKL